MQTSLVPSDKKYCAKISEPHERVQTVMRIFAVAGHPILPSLAQTIVFFADREYMSEEDGALKWLHTWFLHDE